MEFLLKICYHNDNVKSYVLRINLKCSFFKITSMLRIYNKKRLYAGMFSNIVWVIPFHNINDSQGKKRNEDKVFIL